MGSVYCERKRGQTGLQQSGGIWKILKSELRNPYVLRARSSARLERQAHSAVWKRDLLVGRSNRPGPIKQSFLQQFQ